MPSSTIPTTQKAWVVVGSGTPEQALVLNTSYPVLSTLAKGEVLVRVQAAGYNPVDLVSIGRFGRFIAKRPHVLGYDFAGIIADANGTEFQDGQRVYGWVPIALKASSRQGSFCEYLRVPSQLVLPTPSHLKPSEVAGLCVIASTVYRALFYNLRLQPGQHLFVNGGSTSVGWFAIQIAKSMGCTVTATGSSTKEEFLKSLGVDNFVDYTKGPVHEQLIKSPPSPKFDAILEAVGTAEPALYVHCDKYLAPNGAFASVGPQPHKGGGLLGILRLSIAFLTPKWLGGVGRTWSVVQVIDRPDELKEVGKLVADGKVKPVIDSVLEFKDAIKGCERLASRRALGKVVLKVDPSVE